MGDRPPLADRRNNRYCAFDMARRVFQNLPLLILLAILGLRPLVNESYRTSGTAVAAALDETDDPWASATLVIDSVVLATATWVLARRVRQSARTYRRSGLEWGVLLISIAACVSSFVASDRRPAINASLDLVAAAAMCLALVQLLDARWKMRLTLCVIVASGAANAAECAYQQFVSFDETEQLYMQSRESIWAEQGVALDSPNVRMFEQRMRSREASGYFSHSNVAGGYLLLAVFSALALALAGRATDSGTHPLLARGAAAGLALALAGALVLTKGLGAIIAGAAGFVLLLIGRVFAPALARRRRVLLIGGWGFVALGVLAFIAFGMVRGGFPHPSLDFRWQYWTVSARMFADHWATGVGAENFGDHYVRYKPITSPEEVQNPHNLVAQFATEYGPLGLIGVLWLLLAGSSAATRPSVAPSVSPPADGPRSAQGADMSSAGLAFWSLALGAAVFVPQTLLLPSHNVYFVIWATGFASICWMAGFGMTWWTRGGPEDDSATGTGWLTAVNCGLLAFLLQDGINFAFFVPGAMTTFIALVAVTIAARFEPRESAPAAPAWAAVVVCAIATFAAIYSLAVCLPAERALRAARAARDLPANTISGHPAMLLFEKAERLDPLDPTASEERARWLLRMAHATANRTQAAGLAELGLDAIDTAVGRATRRVSLWRTKARLHMICGQVSGDPRDFEAAVAAMDRAIKLYPNNPPSYVQRADCRVALGNCEAVRDAIGDYRHALELDEARPAWETLRRFNDRMKGEVRERLEAALARVAAECPHSEPLPE